LPSRLSTWASFILFNGKPPPGVVRAQAKLKLIEPFNIDDVGG